MDIIGYLLNIQMCYACRYAFNSISEEFNRSTEIFTGVETDKVKRTDGFEYTFELTQSWEEIAEGIIKLKSAFGGGDCGTQFNINDEYLILS